MKRNLLLPIMVSVTGFVFGQIQQITETPAGISARLQYEIDITKDPALGYVPMRRLADAYKFKRDLVEKQKLYKSGGLSWSERGPYSDAVGSSNGNTRPGNGKTSGRVRAMWEDLSDTTGKTVWVGGIAGGLWKTTDISANPATWSLINDFFGNLAVGSICQDPTNHDIMYFGTGEKAANADAVRGAGIWRSTDHGINWSLMSGTSNFWNVSKLICDASGNLYAACNSMSNNAGLQRYTKSTGTWTNITPTGLDARVPDMDLSSTGRLHIICGYISSNTGYRYTDAPATVTSGTWTSPSTTFPTQYNVAIASCGNTLYALPSNSSYQVPTIYKSVNGGANWSALTSNPSFTSGQAWYCMAVAIDPNNANNVIVGSLDCYRSTNGGTSWSKISNWVGTTGQYVHADQQAMIWRKNNRVLVASDGGVHLSNDGGTTFTDRNVGLRIKQFYSVAIHPSSTNYLLAGSQDNGSHQLNGSGLTTSIEVTGGDGAFVHIDQDEPQYQWTSYVYNQYRRSTNSGSSWTSVNYSSSAGRFINPTDYDDVNNIMYCSGSANQFVRWSNPQSGSTFTAVGMTGLNSGTVSAVKVSPYTSHTVFFGGGGSGVTPSLIKATSANGTPSYTSIIGTGMTTSSANISCIELGTSEQNIIVVYSNYGVNNVWVTTNGGTNWSAIDGNLPDMPVRWAMFYPGDNTKALIATETGVWTTSLINGSSTVWSPESSFPNVRTDMFQYRSSDNTLAVATHGRGVFTATLTSGPTCGTVTGLNASAVTDSTATLSWSALSGALNYDVEYKLNSSSTWSVAVNGTTSLSAGLTGLTQGSLYDYRVRANCTGATGAYASAQFTTTTPFTCNAPGGLNSSSVTASSAVLGWSSVSGAVSYQIQYKLNSSSTWTTATNAATGTSYTLSGLTASSLYDWRIMTNCSGSSSGYSQAQFTTAAASTCPGSYDVSTNGSASGAATIPFNTDIYGKIEKKGDNDYYKIVISTAGTATLTLTNLPADFDLRLYASNGTTQLASSANSGTAAETINYTFSAGTYYIRILGYRNAFNASTCYILKAQLGTATEQELQVNPDAVATPLQVNLFPNPVADKLTVYMIGDNTIKQLSITDLSGKIWYTQKTGEMFTFLDLSQLPSGSYLVNIHSGQGKMLFKEMFLKQ